MRKLPGIRLLALWLLAVLCFAQSGRKGGIDKSMMDLSCKPCDDFYQYAVGGWIAKHPIPADKARWGTFDELGDANRERLKTIVDAAAANRSATGDERLVGDYFAGCMDTSALDAAGAKPLQPVLNRIAAVRTRPELIGLLASLELEGWGPPVSIGGTTDTDDANRVITGVGSGGLSLPDRDYYFRDDARSKTIRDEFTQHVARTLELIGDGQASASSGAKTVLDFETTLAGARLTVAARRDPSQLIHKMDFAKLEELAPAFDWAAAFKALNVPVTVAINVSEPEFVKMVNRELTEAPIETWKVWLRWRVAGGLSRYLGKPFYDEFFRFDQTVLSGVEQQTPRWKTCVNNTDSTLGEALGRLYVEKYFPADSQRRIQQLVANLRDALGEQLRAADWLEPETRKNALKKLDTFDPRIGYPVKWHDYSKVRITRGDYVAGELSASLERRQFNMAKIGKEVDRTEWNMTPPTVNANYSASRNSITFPAGILQSPFFEADADDAVNYGGIGAVIGHEMGHGFDDQGSKYDADGNVKNWWTDQDRAKFEARAGCVTSQFGAIDVGGGQHHNGKLVTGEAMGDLGGLTLAYKAYHRSLQGKEAPVIDGLTGDQRFFLAWARVWEGSRRAESVGRLLASDPHPLEKFRTNATLQNMPEFQAAFACKRGDAMVRAAEQRCKLW